MTLQTLDVRHARTVLAAIRLVNGSVALVAPTFMLRRLGTDPEADPSGVYPLRMFGVRTVVMGADLLLLRGEGLRRATQVAVLIHASDMVAAATAGLHGQLPRRVAALATLISATNTALAVASVLVEEKERD